MSADDCEKCYEHQADCICKEFVYLIPFKSDRNICPECMKTFPKFRLPLLTVCSECPNEEIRRKIAERNKNLKVAKPR